MENFKLFAWHKPVAISMGWILMGQGTEMGHSLSPLCTRKFSIPLESQNLKKWNWKRLIHKY